MTNVVPSLLPDENKQEIGSKHAQGVYTLSPTTGLAVDPSGGGGGGGGGTQYTDGAASAANPIGNAIVFDNAGTVTDVGSDAPLPIQVGNGANVVEGLTTDTAVVTDANGTISGKLRGLVKIFADVWDSVNHAFGVKQIGTWTVQPGNTANTTAWKVDGSAVTQPVQGAGTAGTPDTHVVSIQGVASGTPTPTSAASGQFVDGSLATIGAKADTAASDSTSSWTVIALLKGLYAKLAGTIAVSGTFWQATQPTSAASGQFVDGSLATIGLKADTANTDSTSAWTVVALLKGIWAKVAATLTVSQGAATPTTVTLQSAQAGNANGTPLNVSGMSSAVLTVNMTGFTGTVNFEGQEDGTNFKALTAVQVGTRTLTGTAVGSTTTSIALYEIPVAGLQQIQARTSGVSAGTVTVVGHTVPVAYNAKTVNANTAGSDAAGTASTTNPNQIGGIAANALPTAVSNAQVVAAMFEKYGRQVVVSQAPRDLVLPITRLTLTSTTTETSLIAAVASTFNDLVSLMVINTSATATQVDFRDSTGGTIRYSLYVPAGDTRGITLPVPMTQAAVNTAWTAQCGTSVASVVITGSYIANK